MKNANLGILGTILLLDIIDGELESPSVLDFIKWGLVVVCLVLNVIQGKRSKA